MDFNYINISTFLFKWEKPKMASTKGYSQWKKYYKGKGDLELALKKATKLKQLDGQKDGPTPSVGDLIILLELKNDKEYYSYANGTGPNAIAWLPVKYKNKKYLCNIDSMSKPTESGSLDMKLQTANLIEGGSKKKMDLNGQKNVSCMVFTSADTLRKSCLSYIKSNKLLDKNLNLKKSLIGYFEGKDQSKIEWIGSVSSKETAQFKYLGEVAIGILLLSKKTSTIKGDAPFKNDVKEIIFPIDEGFVGVDVCVKTNKGEIVPISSKLSVGAAASFWANVFVKIVNSTTLQKGKILKDLCECAKAVEVTDEKSLKTGAKKIVYEYGIRKLLKISKSQLPDTYQVYKEFDQYDKLTDYSVVVRGVYKKLKTMIKDVGDETALKNLDSSTTVFFCKCIADSLNNSEEAQKIVLQVLGEKDYYQSNQVLSSLEKGVIEFKLSKAGGGTVEFRGNKSAYTNIAASQGTVNYIIHKK